MSEIELLRAVAEAADVLRAERDAAREEARRLREALEELTGDYTGGAANAFEDPYIMERALAALAEPRHD